MYVKLTKLDLQREIVENKRWSHKKKLIRLKISPIPSIQLIYMASMLKSSETLEKSEGEIEEAEEGMQI